MVELVRGGKDGEHGKVPPTYFPQHLPNSLVMIKLSKLDSSVVGKFGVILFRFHVTILFK